MAPFFFDLVFPMKLKSLTYSGPEGTGPLPPGTIVEAELKKTARRAIVLGSRDAKDLPSGGFPLKAIRSVVPDCPALSPALLELIKWMAGYYMVPEGSVLKVMWGGELFEPGKKKKPKKTKETDLSGDMYADSSGALQMPPAHLTPEFFDLAHGLKKLKQPAGYGAFLLHAGHRQEMEFVLAAALEEKTKKTNDEKGVIVTCPERSHLSQFEAAFLPVFGNRLCVLHGGLTPAQRKLAYARILEGKADVVLGTRVALFAPLKKVSLIAVTGEENENYKNREDVRYGGREVAVMRAWLERARVLLSSDCPSAESYMNTLKGKYGHIRLEKKGGNPGIRVIKDAWRKQGPQPAAGFLDKSISDALSRALQKGKSAMLLANRPGHSVPYCEECGHFERCPSCGTALVFHKEGSLSCHYCGFSQKQKNAFLPETCVRCGSHSLKPLGAGIERLAEEIKKLLPMAALRIENKNNAEGEREAAVEMADNAIIFLGTKKISKNAKTAGAAAAALIYPESAFFRPGFRARERLFAEINHLADRLSPDGVLYIQTRNPELFRAMKYLDYEGFMENELEERKALGYPPFSKLAQITIKKEGKGDFFSMRGNLPASNSLPVMGGLPDMGRGNPSGAGEVEILGPVQKTDERGGKFYSILVKASSAQALKKAVAGVLKTIRAGKVTVDIDPV